MRAMTASGTVPSTMVGRMRWRTASQKAPFWSGQQRVDQHEAGDRLEIVFDEIDAAGHRRQAAAARTRT